MLKNSTMANRKQIWAVVQALTQNTKLKQNNFKHVIKFFGIQNMMREKYLKQLEGRGLAAGA